MQGAPQVRLNDADDQFLCNGKKITVTGRLVPSFATPGEYPNLGIITSGSDRVITSGYGRYNRDFTNPYNFFFSRDYHELETRDGELYKDVEKFFGGFVKISSTKGVVDNYTNAAALLLILGITAIVDYSRDNDVVGAGIGGGYDADGGDVSISGKAIVCAKTGASTSAIGKGKKGDENGELVLWEDLMVLAGSSPEALSRASAGSREALCRARCAEILPCDHQGADFDRDAYYHLSHCKWCKKHEAESHTYDSSGLQCTVCGYERCLVSFDANGGSGTMEPVYVAKGSDYKLPGCGFSPPEGMVFIGWSVNGSEELLPPNTPVRADGSIAPAA